MAYRPGSELEPFTRAAQHKGDYRLQVKEIVVTISAEGIGQKTEIIHGAAAFFVVVLMLVAWFGLVGRWLYRLERLDGSW